MPKSVWPRPHSGYGNSRERRKIKYQQGVPDHMEQATDTELSERLPVAQLRTQFEGSPVRVAICFGSQARGKTHGRSDIDFAVEFDEIQSGDEEYNEAYFRLLAALTTVLETENVDLVDVRATSDSLVRTILDQGILLYGSVERVETLREELLTDEPDSPRERLDGAIERIDEHLA